MSDFSRHEKLIGEEGIKRLAGAHVAVFGIGGVGGYAAEALARAAVGRITLVDSDDVEPTNINRQIIALLSTVGTPKVDAMKARIKDINPGCRVTAKKVFVNAENISALLDGVTYAVDAVDNVSAKLAIITACVQAGIPVISAMGAGNKLSGDFRVRDIYQTKDDPLARVMRRELKKRGIGSLKVVSADAKAARTLSPGEPVPSISYMPGLCGLMIAGEVIRDIIGVSA
ncbi:MAG: tRNA threonylcarbamoyladenosine dehydratase [Eubacteriales bacterium]|nr:tRNA threonylcarbamoyladenosine dehydratase [Eubacteriales bacterium]